jgi:hypothetical protein
MLCEDPEGFPVAGLVFDRVFSLSSAFSSSSSIFCFSLLALSISSVYLENTAFEIESSTVRTRCFKLSMDFWLDFRSSLSNIRVFFSLFRCCFRSSTDSIY